MTLLEMVWIGGPQDGAILEIEDDYCLDRIKVVYGQAGKPEERYVTPRHLSDGRWILPWTDNITSEETR